MEANLRWGHFDGTTPCPTPQDPSAPTTDEIKAREACNQDKNVARYLLSQRPRVPDSTAVRLQSLTTAKEKWAKVKSEFSVKSQYAEADMLTTFTELRSL